MEENRDVLRGEALSRRSSLSQANCALWSHSIQSKALKLPQYLAARSVALYSPAHNEVDTEAILKDALAAGKQVYFPRLNRVRPEFVRIFSKADLTAGRFGIAEPVGTNGLSLEDYDGLSVFIPGVLFDRSGHRLGRGGGWYDRALAQFGNLGVFIGLAYEVQIVDSLPTESWDQKVHYIITENKVIDCASM